jgi:hypothetical protein
MDEVRQQRHRRDGGDIAEVILDRPDSLNALNTAALTHLARLCAEIGADDQVRVVVLSAAGERAFSVGADLKERAAMSRSSWCSRTGAIAAYLKGSRLTRPSVNVPAWIACSDAQRSAPSPRAYSSITPLVLPRPAVSADASACAANSAANNPAQPMSSSLAHAAPAGQ